MIAIAGMEFAAEWKTDADFEGFAGSSLDVCAPAALAFLEFIL
jgi:hypothetical protein